MDGKTLRNALAFQLRELTTSSFLDTKTSYDYLYEAALEFQKKTQALSGSQSITTVAETSAYTLNADFLNLRIWNDSNELVAKYYDGSSTLFIPYRSHEAIIVANQTTSTNIPANVSVTNKESQASNVTGTATSTGSASEAEPQLTDTAGDFSGVSVGDEIHNTTDASDGIVVEVTSGTVLKTALFYGTNNFWTSADAYIIVPQGRKQLIVDPLSKTAGHTITVYYNQKPAPVYTNFRTYRFDTSYAPALVKYAAWLYKYRDTEPNFGDAFFKYFQAQTAQAVADTNKSFDRTRFRVNMVKRSLYDRSYR